MNTTISRKNAFKERYFLALIALSTFLGSFLRLYQLDAQVIGDDEWHGIYWAVKSSFADIFSHFHGADNCIPLTAYYKALLETTGLNEFGLHSPQIFCGLASLVLFPLIVKSVFQKRIVLIFSFFVAISPFLTFYSRYARPYILVVFLSFISIFSFYFWIKKHNAIYVVIYLCAAVLAPYFLLPSFISVITPLFYTAAFFGIRKVFSRGPEETASPRLIHIFFLGMFLFAGLAILFFPTINSFGAIRQKVHGNLSDIGFQTVMRALNLFNGTTSSVLSVLFAALCVYGAYLMCRKDIFLFGYLFSIIALQLSSLFIVRPTAVSDPVVFARYSISCLPLWLLFVSVGLHEVSLRFGSFFSRQGNERPGISNTFLIGCFFIFFLKGPLPTIYQSPNNFTNHSDYQADYAYTWAEADPYSFRYPLPKFYFYLKGLKEATIVETPFIIEWRGDNYHIYQRLHRKNVVIGHTDHSYLTQSDPVVSADIHLRNFVDIENVKEILGRNISFIVVHKDPVSEFFSTRKNFPDFEANVEEVRENKAYYEKLYGSFARKEAEQSISFLQRTFGNPFYQDTEVVVFKIK
jgi:hypothetical protein